MLIRLVCVLCLTASVHASATIVFRTPDRIVLATDSLLQIHGDAVRRDRTVCKITKVGAWWLVDTGLTFDPIPALTTARTIAEVRTALIDNLPTMRAKIATARKSSAFAKLYTPGDIVGQVIVAGRDLSVAILVLTLTPTDVAAAWLTCPGVWCPDGQLHFAASVAGPLIGDVSHVQRADAATARQLIERQIAATPTEVRGPVDVLTITREGARWVERDPASHCTGLRD